MQMRISPGCRNTQDYESGGLIEADRCSLVLLLVCDICACVPWGNDQPAFRLVEDRCARINSPALWSDKGDERSGSGGIRPGRLPSHHSSSTSQFMEQADGLSRGNFIRGTTCRRDVILNLQTIFVTERGVEMTLAWNEVLRELKSEK
jgi:hypothetical protein